LSTASYRKNCYTKSMLKGIVLNTKWAHNQQVSYIAPDLRDAVRNPRKHCYGRDFSQMSTNQMRNLEISIFGRPLF